MPEKTKAHLLAENATLRAHLVELTDTRAHQPAGAKPVPARARTDRTRAAKALRQGAEALEASVRERTAGLVQANEQLQHALDERTQEEAMLRLKASAIASSIHAMAITDLELQITYVNEAFVRLYQYETAEAMLGTALPDYTASPQAMRTAVAALQETGGWVGELVGKHRDDSTFSMHVAASPVKDGIGTPTFMLLSCLDITEDKRAAAALQEGWERLETAQHITRVGSWEWNLRTETMLFCDEMFRLLGVNRDKGPPTYAQMLMYVHPEDRARYESSLQEALAAHRPYHTHHRVMGPGRTSTVVLSQGQGYYDATGMPVRLLGTMVALQESEGRYWRLFQTAQDGILILDAETGQITDANPFLEELLGYGHAELIGKALWEIGAFKDVAASQQAFRQLQVNEYIRYDNLPLETKRGEHKQVEFVSNVYLVNDRRVIQCNIRDITLRKQTEDNIQQTHDELRTLVTALQMRDQEMQALNHMHDLLQACTTLTEAYHVTAQIARDLFDGQQGCLAIFYAENRHLEVVARWGEGAIVEPIFPLEECWAMRRGQLHEVFDANTGMLCRHFLHPPSAGHVCVPLMVQGDILGVLCLLKAGATPERPRSSQQQLAVAVGEAIKLALANLKLREALRDQAIHDALTGLYNRRYLEDSLGRELSRAQRRESPLCVVILDLDHFKQFNDTAGHAAGDAVLREFGRLLRENVRHSDISCRYGGEEFVLVLPDSSLADTRQRVVQICGLLKTLQIRHGESLLGMVTASAGIAEWHASRATASALLHAADQALYAAKQAGRDCVVLYQEKEA